MKDDRKLILSIAVTCSVSPGHYQRTVIRTLETKIDILEQLNNLFTINILTRLLNTKIIYQQ